MARQTLILARSITEANQYAKVAGLPRFAYRSVRNAGAIRGVRNAEVHVLSSFASRLDRHAILSALRWAKLDVFYVVFENGDIVDPNPEARFSVGSDGEVTEGPRDDRYPNDDRTHEIALRYNGLLNQAADDFARVIEERRAARENGTTEETSGEETGAAEPSEDPAPPAPPKRRRRSRCKDCGNLHYPEEPCAADDPEENRADDNGFAQRPPSGEFLFN